jgi:hypothetical protein
LSSTRRQFVLQTAAGMLAAGAGNAAPEFSCSNAQLQQAYDSAVNGLKSNLQDVFRFPRPVLLEGATYAGVWLECAPLEGLVYAPLSPETAQANHEVFLDLQREDGYLPCNVKKATLGTGQIQMVVPIAATAWDLYRQNGRAAFLAKTYAGCSRWDAWLVRYRNTPRLRPLRSLLYVRHGVR